MSEDRMNVIIMGRFLGTASGWDQVTDWVVQFYDFQCTNDALKHVKGIVSIISIDHETGIVEFFDDNDDVLLREDFIDFVTRHNFPRFQELKKMSRPQAVSINGKVYVGETHQDAINQFLEKLTEHQCFRFYCDAEDGGEISFGSINRKGEYEVEKNYHNARMKMYFLG